MKTPHVAILSTLVSLAGAAAAEPLPTHIGGCSVTRITEIGGRLQGDSDFSSGTSVGFAGKGYQVSYDKISAIVASRIGDAVRICLVSLPSGCPKGDVRGKIYRTTNLRTHRSWTLPDSEHGCGGA